MSKLNIIVAYVPMDDEARIPARVIVQTFKEASDGEWEELIASNVCVIPSEFDKDLESISIDIEDGPVISIPLRKACHIR